MSRAIYCTFPFVLQPSSLFASASSTATTPGSGELVNGLLVLTGLVVGICLLITWWARRAVRLPSLPRTQHLRLLDSVPVDSGGTVHLFQVGQFQLAVSVNRDEIDSMCPVTPSFSQILQSNRSHSVR